MMLGLLGLPAEEPTNARPSGAAGLLALPPERPGGLRGLLSNWGRWTDNPEKNSAISQGLLTAGLQMMQSKGKFGNALGQGGMAGVNQFQQQMQMAGQNRTRELQHKMQEQQLAQMERANQLREARAAALKGAYRPASPGIGSPNGDYSGDFTAPASPGGFDAQKYFDNLAATGDDAALDVLPMLRAEQPQYKVVGGSLVKIERGGVSEAYRAPDKPGEEPPIVKALRLSGVDPQSPEGQRKIRQWVDKQATHAPAASTNVNLMQEKEENKAVGKWSGEQYAKLQEAGIGAQGRIDRASRMSNLMSRIQTGKLEGIKKEIAGYAKTLGIPIDPNLPEKEAFEALSNQLALEARNPSGGAGMPGAMSDKDREFLVNITPGLSKSPEGNKLIIETTRKLAQRDMEVAKMARQYRQRKGQLDEGFYDELQAFAERNPLFGGATQPAGPRFLGFED